MPKTKGKQLNPDFVTIQHGMRGYFAVLMSWSDECGGFFEPYDTGVGSYATYEAAIPEAREWARSEGIRCSIRQPAPKPKIADEGMTPFF